MSNEEEKVGCDCGHDCDCDDNSECGCGGHDEPLTVELEDEDGNIVQCEVVDGFTYKDNEYAVIENPDDGAVYLFKVVGTDDVGELVVPDEEEFEEVSAYYEESFGDEE